VAVNDPAPGDTALDAGYTTERYLALRDEGALTPDDRVELLEGVIVAVPPQSPSHAGTTSAVADAIRRAVGTRAAVREEKPLVLAPRSMPEPDVAVVRGRHADYRRAHPTTALLVIEVAESSLPQDRLTKSRIYARARIEEFWIVNLREDRVEVFRDPDPARRVYRTRFVAARGERLAVAELPGVTVETNDLLPAESDG
jgi:Uma2 family endonuclease